ncbi:MULTISPECIES: hypothetical protein [Pelosinus]|uniref:Uncharacterized protein n=1 Tax=Pelosinus fermentans B4 TaxID=1149862 RepID=I9LGX6_9FIRM|nr:MULTISPECIES: hypothetical protein [Pelosinus]EIW19754.1 hypothetical protein FB4_0005 [Pelosinus fermentans B4]EIW21389.1 hypothetical protein FA11_1116 [Pelosinus fermentans A11]OAM94907.1 hypothetical protein FR7_02928 [Pelosinus fermentans DSM 17108]SDR20109.1 hypothetical protein SAMN04515679_3057 [Pelosinus fermentans]
MREKLYRTTIFISFLLSLATLLWTECIISETTEVVSAWAECRTNSMENKPAPTVHFPQQIPASIKPVLTWTKVEGDAYIL